MNRANRNVCTTFTKLRTVEAHVGFLENSLDIVDRWTPSSIDYQSVKVEANHRAYRCTLNDLERLVVQRLLELTKLNIAGTGNIKYIPDICPLNTKGFIGYKLQTHISKALQCRSEVIRKVLTKYNQQAQKLSPPRPTLSWMQVVDYGFLGKFDLLCNSRTNIHNEEWAKPGHHELTTQYMELSHVREELDQLNIEIKWLRTYMHHEAQDYEEAVRRVSVMDPALAAEITRWWSLCHAINTLHEQCLAQVFAMPGFSGSTGLGRPLLPSQGTPPTQVRGATLNATSNDNVVQEVLIAERMGLQNISKEEQHNMDAFTDFVDALHT